MDINSYKCIQGLLKLLKSFNYTINLINLRIIIENWYPDTRTNAEPIYNGLSK